MRRFTDFLLIIILSCLSVSALAHAGPEELGHHWYVAKYANELKLQTNVMLAFIVGVVVVVAVKRAIARRKNKI